MNSMELKRALDADIQRIKRLNPDIIPARFYYGALLKLFFSGFWKIWLIILATFVYTGIRNPSNDVMAHDTVMHIIQDAALSSLFLSLGAMLLLTQTLNFSILVRFHLERQLKTGPLLVKKLKQFAHLFFGVFTVVCALCASFAESSDIFFLMGFTYFGSLLITYFVVSMEINRIGLNLLFSVMHEFFQKDQKGHWDSVN
ncbi:hypothetical protein FOLKNPGA_01732 [Legionella sp. PC1000]|uniref:hypothetical protein n=1 Tax=Legionella sp. PC1000 TaxID=2746060 RepID=UPI0015F94F07|nr:hypothetical protein [Legionella sp. PC1000]QLZ68952.1 hypothetical protein FOLKNPGA_01732 [Legionella sp. PC1000]